MPGDINSFAAVRCQLCVPISVALSSGTAAAAVVTVAASLWARFWGNYRNVSGRRLCDEPLACNTCGNSLFLGPDGQVGTMSKSVCEYIFFLWRSLSRLACFHANWPIWKWRHQQGECTVDVPTVRCVQSRSHLIESRFTPFPTANLPNFPECHSRL